MEKNLPDHGDLTKPYKSKRSFVYEDEEMDRNQIRLMEVKEFNERVLPRLMNIQQG